MDFLLSCLLLYTHEYEKLDLYYYKMERSKLIGILMSFFNVFKWTLHDIHSYMQHALCMGAN